MTSDPSDRIQDLEESAQGHDLFHAPGNQQMLEQAMEQAEASGWLPPRVSDDWPTNDVRRAITKPRRRLYEAMRRLETTAARASGQPDWVENIEEACRDLKAELEHHVKETEAPDGLLNDVIGQAPRLAAAAESLRQDHQILTRICDQLVDATSSQPIDASALRREVIAMLGRLVQHRQRGAELLFDAYDVDLGDGD